MIRPNRIELKQKYSAFGATLSSLAKEYGVSQPSVRKWMIQYNIERKTHLQASQEANIREHEIELPSREELVTALNKNSIQQVSYNYNIGLIKIHEWIRYFNIDIDFRKRCVEGKGRQFAEMHAITKEQFLEQYHKAGSLVAMAEIIGRDRAWLNRKRKELGIDLLAVKTSSHEKKLQQFLENNNINFESNDRSIISPKELDIVIPSHKLAIEICGTMWHSEHFGNKSRQYHRNKMLNAANQNYQLITLWDYEVAEPKTNNLLISLIGKHKRIGARSCQLKQITYKEVKGFEQAFHMMGSRPAKIYLGLYYQDELASTMSFAKSRYSSKHEWEMIRYCNGNLKIVGSASKLFNYFNKIYQPSSVITYSDLRFGQGNVYKHLGFTRQKDTPPNYFYFHKSDPSTLFSRVKFQKHKLQAKLDIFSPNLTEIDNMLNNGYQRVWDCGNAVWTINSLTPMEKVYNGAYPTSN
jgi:G:T-mismatch repair DNA endonuclease (very short patch repair protein)